MKNNLRCLGIFMLFFCWILQVRAQSFEWLNPLPAGYSIRDIDFTNADQGYAINGAHLLSTEDAGLTWKIKQPLNFDATDLDFSGDVGYLVGSTGFIYRSSDAGKTWVRQLTTNTDILNSVTVVSSDTIFISSTSKILRTYNGGQTWQSYSQTQASIKKIIFTDGKTGHAFCNGKVMKTTNGGESWMIKYSVNVIPSNFLTAFMVNKKVGYASKEHTDLLKTTDGGESWFPISSSDGIYAMHFLDEKTGFIGGDHGVIFKTTNGGTTWTNVFFQPGRYDNTSIHALYFFNASTGIAGGARGRIINTSDGGESWKSKSFTYNDIQALIFPKSNTIYAVGSGFHKSVDNGLTWTKHTTGLSENQYYYTTAHFTSPDTGYVVASDYYLNKMVKTTDGGATWTEVVPFQRSVYSIHFLDGKTGYSSGGYSWPEMHVALTTDGGKTWTQKNASRSFRKIYFTDLLTGYGIDYSGLNRTTDGGKTWKLAHSSSNLTKIFFVNKLVGYVAAEFNTVLKTTDGGLTWKELKTKYDHLFAIYFINEKIGFVCGEYGTLQSTYDGGLTWDSRNIGFNIQHLTHQDDYLYMAGKNGIILREKLNIPDYNLSINPATNIKPSSAKISGIASAINKPLEQLSIVYSTDEIQWQTVTPSVTALPTGSADSIKAELTGLKPLTKYFYRVKGKSNGLTVYSPTSFFYTPQAPIFNLPANNFRIRSSSTSCQGKGNGSVTILAASKLNYIVNITSGATSKQRSFTDSIKLDSLTAGTYKLCIATVEEPDFRICINPVIKEPESLTIYTSIKNSNELELALSGGSSYTIKLNGLAYTTSDSSIRLPLSAGTNKLLVSTDVACQGSVEKTLELTEDYLVYPNPFENTINIASDPATAGPEKIAVYTNSGKLVFNSEINNASLTSVNLSELASGIYFLKRSTGNSETYYKLIKK